MLRRLIVLVQVLVWVCFLPGAQAARRSRADNEIEIDEAGVVREASGPHVEEICSKRVAEDTCAALNGDQVWLLAKLSKAGESNKAQALATSMKTEISVSKLRTLLSANDVSARLLLNTLGMEASKPIPCRTLCEKVRDRIEKKGGTLPPGSGIGCRTDSKGRLKCDKQLGSRALAPLAAVKEMPNFHKGDGKFKKRDGRKGTKKSIKPKKSPELEYGEKELLKRVGELFEFFPVVDPTPPPGNREVNDAREHGLLTSNFIATVIRNLNLPATQVYMHEWFGNTSTNDEVQMWILTVLNSVEHVLNNVHFYWEGPDCGGPGTYAYVVPEWLPPPYSGGGCTVPQLGLGTALAKCAYTPSGPVDDAHPNNKFVFFLCRNYMVNHTRGGPQIPAEKVLTLFHEGSHHGGLAPALGIIPDGYATDDVDFNGGTAYGRNECAALAAADTPGALSNADNHAYFALAVAATVYHESERCPPGSTYPFKDQEGNCY